MARESINQETFNDAVRANIENSELSPANAVTQAIKHYEAKGVDLRSIVKEPPTYFEHIKEVIAELASLNKSRPAPQDVIEKLTTIKMECDKGLEYRILIGRFGVYPILLDSLTREKDDAARKLCLKTFISLMDKQPDFLDDSGIEAIMNHVSSDFNLETRRLALKWARVCCIMHESNRQKLFSAGILEPLKELLNEDFAEILRETLSLCRALVLDDDVRAEFGKAQDYSRMVANDTLCSLVALLYRFRLDELLINDILSTIHVLLVRVEYCQKVANGGGLESIKDIMIAFDSDEKINKHCFKVLRALAGDDQCKAQIIQNDFAPVITKSLDVNKGHVQTTTAGLQCVAAVALRSPQNSMALIESGIPEIIVNIIRLYPDEKLIQKSASWAVRNIVSRRKSQSAAKFLDLGIEQLLANNLAKFPDIEYDTKAALRDLGCKY